MEDVADHLHLCVLDKLDMDSFCIGPTVEPSIVTTSRPFGYVFNTIGGGGYLEVGRFQLCRDQANIVPQATIVGLASKLSIV